MAGPIHRRSIAGATAFALLLAMVALGTSHPAIAAVTGCQWVSPEVTVGRTPILFVHGINSSTATWTTGQVGGTTSPPLQYVQDSLGPSNVTGYTFDWSFAAGGQGNPVMWVTDPLSPSLGVRLAQAISCLARTAGHRVIIIAHSMGGLLTQYASHLDPGDIAAVFTLGTPYQGSWLASAASGQGPGGSLSLLVEALRAACWPVSKQSLLYHPCLLLNEQHDPGVEAMTENPVGGWKALPPWPAGVPVYSLAGSISGAWQPVWPLGIQVPLTGSGDTVVSTGSERAAWPGMTLNCPVRLGLGSPVGPSVTQSILDVLSVDPCVHWNEPDTKALLDYIVAQARPMLPTATVGPTSQTPAFYVHNGYVLGSLYQYPAFPKSIGLDNHDFISGLVWSNMSQTAGTATGTLNVDNCTPACASGSYITYPVELLVSDPQQCTVQVYKPYSDVAKSESVYVYNTTYLKVLSGTPPSYLVGNAAFPSACQSGPGNTAPTSGSGPTPGNTSSPDLTVTQATTYQQGALVYFSITYEDLDNDAEGFGFVGVNGSGWAEESHPFSSPSYGIVAPGKISYPFNLGCGTAQASQSDVEAWIYDTAGARSQPVIIHLACAS